MLDADCSPLVYWHPSPLPVGSPPPSLPWGGLHFFLFLFFSLSSSLFLRSYLFPTSPLTLPPPLALSPPSTYLPPSSPLFHLSFSLPSPCSTFLPPSSPLPPSSFLPHSPFPTPFFLFHSTFLLHLVLPFTLLALLGSSVRPITRSSWIRHRPHQTRGALSNGAITSYINALMGSLACLIYAAQLFN